MLRSSINILTKPKEQVFLAEKTNRTVSLSKVLKWMLLASIIAASIKTLRITILDIWVLPGPELEYPEHITLTGHIVQAIFYVSLRVQHWLWEIDKIYALFWIHSGLVKSVGNLFWIVGFDYLSNIPYLQQVLSMVRGLLDPVFFLINLLLFHFFAVRLGGQGKLNRYGYLILLFSAPLTILQQILLFTPLAIGSFVSILPGSSLMAGQILYGGMRIILGTLIGISFAGYWFFLACLATKVEYKLSWWKVIIIILVGSLIGNEIRDLLPNLFVGLTRMGQILDQ